MEKSEQDIAQEIIKNTIGDYIFQIALLKAKVEVLEKIIANSLINKNG